MKARALVSAFGFQAALLCALPPVARALPPPAEPKVIPSERPSSGPFTGAVLPYGSTLLVVLDEPLDSSRDKPGTTVPLHLKNALIVNGRTLAQAGTKSTLTVIANAPAQAGDINGAVQIRLSPLDLPGVGELPLRGYHEYLDFEWTVGQDTTRALTDQLQDIFVPYYVLYQAFRKGHQFHLPAGSELRVLTGATVDTTGAVVRIEPPAPVIRTFDVPHSDLTPVPLYTARPTPSPVPRRTPTPAASPSPPPAASPSPGGTPEPASPGPSPSPGASAAPSPHGSANPR